MIKIHYLTIPGRPVSQKNSKRIAVNKKTGKRFPISSESVRAWRKSARVCLRSQWPRKSLTGPLGASVRVFFGLRQARMDLDNSLPAVLDALEDAGVVANDNDFTYLELTRLKDPKTPGLRWISMSEEMHDILHDAIRVLVEIEYVGPPKFQCCPFCFTVKGQGHYDGCALQRVLSRTQQYTERGNDETECEARQ